MTSLALLIAAKNGYFQEVHDLLQEGHSVRSRDGDNATALYWVACYGYTRICEELLRCGAEVDARVRWGSTPLHAACDRGKNDCVKMLLKHGSDINCQNQRLDTPLHLAAYRGHTDIIHTLVENGANPDLLNGRRKTAELEAQGQGYDLIAQIIRDTRQNRSLPRNSARFQAETDIHISFSDNQSFGPLSLRGGTRSTNTPRVLSPEEPNSPFSWDGASCNRRNRHVKSGEVSSKSLNHVRDTQTMKLRYFMESNRENFVESDSKPLANYLYDKYVYEAGTLDTNAENNAENGGGLGKGVYGSDVREKGDVGSQELLMCNKENKVININLNTVPGKDVMGLDNVASRKNEMDKGNKLTWMQDVPDMAKTVTWDILDNDPQSRDPVVSRDVETAKWKTEAFSLRRELMASKELAEELRNELKISKDKLSDMEKKYEENSRLLLREQNNCDRLLEQLNLASEQTTKKAEQLQTMKKADECHASLVATSALNTLHTCSDMVEKGENLPCFQQLRSISADLMIPSSNSEPTQPMQPVPTLSIFHNQSIRHHDVTGGAKTSMTHESVYSCLRRLSEQKFFSNETFVHQARAFQRSLRRDNASAEKIALDSPCREWRYGIDYQVMDIVRVAKDRHVTFRILHKQQTYSLRMFLQERAGRPPLPPHPNISPILHRFTSHTQPFRPILSTHTHSYLLPTLPPTAQFYVVPDSRTNLTLSDLVSEFGSASPAVVDQYLLHLIYQLLAALTLVSRHQCIAHPLSIHLSNDLIPIIDVSDVSQISHDLPTWTPRSSHSLKVENSSNFQVLSGVHQLGALLRVLTLDCPAVSPAVRTIISRMLPGDRDETIDPHDLMLRVGMEMFGPEDPATITTQTDCVLYYLARVTKCLCIRPDPPTSPRPDAEVLTLSESVANNVQKLETHFFSQIMQEQFCEVFQRCHLPNQKDCSVFYAP